jgi:hypothetical protein
MHWTGWFQTASVLRHHETDLTADDSIMAKAMRQSIEAGTGQALALAKFFAEWKLPGASTLLSLATVLSFIFSQWSNVPGEPHGPV